MKNDDLKIRTKIFAHRCVKLALSLPNDALGNHKKKQLIRCSTSTAANYRAACLAHSKAAFTSKISIVIEEVDESDFWIEFLTDKNFKPKELVEKLMNEAQELTSIFVSSRKTLQTGNDLKNIHQ